MELGNIQIGDKVLVRGNFERRAIGIVTKITDKMIFIGNSRYWRSNGALVGRGEWSTDKIEILEEATEKLIHENIEKRKIKDVLEKEMHSLTLEQLRKIKTILEQP